MERILFRHSLTSRLLLAIIAFPTILTLGGFFIFQQTEYKRIVEFKTFVEFSTPSSRLTTQRAANTRGQA